MDDETKLLDYYDQAQQYNANVNDARIKMINRTSSLFTNFIYACIWVTGCIAIFFGCGIYRIYSRFKELIQITDQANLYGVTGLQVAISLQNSIFALLFGPSPNRNFSNAVWLMYYDTSLRKSILANADNASILTPAIWKTALESCHTLAKNNPSFSALTLACQASNAKSNSDAGSTCFPTCQLPSMMGQDPAMAGAQGAIGMAGAIGGMGMMLGPVGGAIGACIGAIFGGIMSGIQAAEQKKKEKEHCLSVKNGGTCYWPPTFDNC